MQKKKDKICKLHESIETLSLSHTLSRSKLDLSNFVSTNAATRFRAALISDIEQPIAFQRTVSSVPEIVVHLDNYSSLPIPPPPSSSPSHDTGPIPQTSSSTKLQKLRFQKLVRSILAERYLPGSVRSRPANPFFRSMRIPFEFSFEWKSFQEGAREEKKKHSLRLRIAWLINRNLVEIEICRETIIRAIEKNRIGVDSGGSVPRLHPRYLDTCNGQPESRFAVVDCVEPWIVRGVGKWPRSLEVGV